MQAADRQAGLVCGRAQIGGLAVVQARQFDLAVTDRRDLLYRGVAAGRADYTAGTALLALRLSVSRYLRPPLGRDCGSFEHCDSSCHGHAREQRTTADCLDH
jgi:hypothetical protein